MMCLKQYLDGGETLDTVGVADGLTGGSTIDGGDEGVLAVLELTLELDPVGSHLLALSNSNGARGNNG